MKYIIVRKELIFIAHVVTIFVEDNTLYFGYTNNQNSTYEFKGNKEANLALESVITQMAIL